mmetsp:Transcript_32458/g.82364  ORF Transcript_32458/g.82364 Transcript_32458/m.82364 type:complete len:248 (-) Transcript_32458:117-860(-)
MPLREGQDLKVRHGGRCLGDLLLLLQDIFDKLLVLVDEREGHVHLRLIVEVQPRNVLRRDDATIILGRQGQQVAHPHRLRESAHGAVRVRGVVPDHSLRLQLFLLACVRHRKDHRPSGEDQHPVVGIDGLLPQRMHAVHPLPQPEHLLDHLEGGRGLVEAGVPQGGPPIVHLERVREVQDASGILLAAVEEHGKALHTEQAEQGIVIQLHVPIKLVDEPRQVVVLHEVQQQATLSLRSLFLHPIPKS